MMHILTIVTALAALALVCGAAIIDVVRYQIPDEISIGVLILGIVFGIATPGFAWWSHAAAPVIMFAFGLLAFGRGWLGGGDVKLMTAIAAWAGLTSLPVVFLATSVAGGGLALIMMFRRRFAGTTAVAATHVPYAVAIAVGTLWWLWATGGPLAPVHATGVQRPLARAIAT